MKQINLSWVEFRSHVAKLSNMMPKKQWHSYSGIYGIPSGGSHVATELCQLLQMRQLDVPADNCVVVDDIIDSGKTMMKFHEYDKYAVFSKINVISASLRCVAAMFTESWIVFPWENNTSGPEDSVIRLLEHIGEDPKRPGLKETPARVVKALKEMTEGYSQDPKQILSKVFEETYDEVVVLRGIPFTSLCEHHLLVFSGTVDIGYLPDKKVVGLSKLARLVDCFSRRLQIQEKMTREIAEAINTHLEAKGAAVVVRGEHSCMACRGVRKSGTEMVTSSMTGTFLSNPAARAEFLSLLSLGVRL